MNTSQITNLSAVLAVFTIGCAQPVAEKAQPTEFTAEERNAAVVEAATARFNSTVKETFLDKGMPVRSLRWNLEQLPKQRRPSLDPELAKLLPARFDEHSSAAAKLELVKGKVMYTAVAGANDASAAVLSNGRDQLRLGYLLVAEVGPEGDLRDPDIRRVDEVRASTAQALK